MLIKRFEGPTMAEALRQVRETLGPDAIVLSTRALRREGARFGWFGRSRVEVTAGIDREAKRANAPEGEPRVAADPSWRDLAISRALLEPLEDELRSLRGTVERLVANGPPLTLVEEVAALRTLARELTSSVEAPSGPVASYRAAGLLPRHCTGLARDVERLVLAGEPADRALCASLSARLAGRIAPPREGVRVQIVVGPPGSGKTTTLAKLAGRQVESGRRLRLVTMDLARDGEAQRLKRIAEQLGARFALASGAPAIANLVKSSKTDECLLVDTPACARRANELLGELAAVREAHQEASIHLVLSATTKENDLRSQIARHAALAPDDLVVTNWDESTEVANVVNLLLDPDVPPLAALGNGPGVPDDLVLPDADTIARSVLVAAR